MRKLKIAFICDYLEIGGQEIACLNILKSLNKKKFSTFLYAFRGGELLPEFRKVNAKILIGSHQKPFCNKWTKKDQGEKKDYFEKLKDRLKEDKIDIALIFAWNDGVKAAIKSGVPVIIEKLDGEYLIGKIKNKKYFHKIICESNRIKNLISEHKEIYLCKNDRLRVMHNGIDFDFFDPGKYHKASERRKIGLEPGDFVLGYIGRIAPEKNLKLLLKTLKELIGQRKSGNVKLLIAGPDHGSLKSIVKTAHNMQFEDSLVFLKPKRKDIPAVLSALDIFVMSSKTEVIPLAIIEAMRMRLPIISTNVGSVKEAIRGNGFLIADFDHKNFAKKVLFLMNNDALRKKMAAKSAELAEKFNIRNTIREYEKTFFNLTKNFL